MIKLMINKDEDYRQLTELQGKTVAAAEAGKNEAGYDMLIVTFTDGTVLTALDDIEAGHTNPLYQIVIDYTDPRAGLYHGPVESLDEANARAQRERRFVHGVVRVVRAN